MVDSLKNVGVFAPDVAWLMILSTTSLLLAPVMQHFYLWMRQLVTILVFWSTAGTLDRHLRDWNQPGHVPSTAGAGLCVQAGVHRGEAPNKAVPGMIRLTRFDA